MIEHAENETNITMNSGLVVNTVSTDSYFNGYLRDGNFGAGSTGRLFLYKSGSYKLTLVGPNVSGYTGGTTVNGGTLQFGDGTTNAMLPGNASVASGATIAFNLAGGGSNITYPGVISGAGGVKILARPTSRSLGQIATREPRSRKTAITRTTRSCISTTRPGPPFKATSSWTAATG